MPLLFSYGTLQQEDVQRSTFGRLLKGQEDELPCFEPSRAKIEDPEVVAELGETHHANVTFNGRSDSRVRGMVFEVTDAELAAADAYEEPAGYTRVTVGLASGKQAWVYRNARGRAEPVIRVRVDDDGRPLGAAAVTHVRCAPERVWTVIADIERYPGRVPMIHRVRRDGDRVTIDLKFKVALFSVGFTFTADATYEAGRWLELRWVAGEPHGIRLRFDLEPAEEGRSCIVKGEGEFDVHSLGWLTKYFLKHHPEIEYGIFPGVALALIDSIRRAAERE